MKSWNKPASGVHAIPRPRGLLPTPGTAGNRFCLPAPKPQGLLPRPPLLQSPLQKKPLLQTPHQPPPPTGKPALLPSPTTKPFAPTQQQWQRKEKPAKPVGTVQGGRFKNPHFNRAPAKKQNKGNRFEKSKQPSVTELKSTRVNVGDAYKLHKEKLSKNAGDDKPSNSSLGQVDKGFTESSDGLTRLASYLLQMKSDLQSPPRADESSNVFVIDDDDTEEQSKNNENKPLDESHDITDATLLDGEDGFSDLSAINESQENKLLADQSLNEKKTLDGKQSKSSNKKHSIQLSHYASGSENVQSDSGQPTSVEYNAVVDEDISDRIFVYESSVETDTSNNAQQKKEDLQHVEERNQAPSDVAMKKSDSFTATKTFDDSTPKSSALKHKENRRTVVDAKPKVSKDAEKSEIDDQPFIFRVSGYFCDACCDFFFDKETTMEHCKSTQHRLKAEAAAPKKDEKPGSKRRQRDPAKRKPSASVDEETNNPQNKKKQKVEIASEPSSLGKGNGFTNTQNKNSRSNSVEHETVETRQGKSSHKPVKTRSNKSRQKRKQSEEIADSVYVMEAESTSPYDNGGETDHGNQKAGKWKDFVIPKRR